MPQLHEHKDGWAGRGRRLWRQPNGYQAVLRISLPLLISMGAHTVMLFTDRVFLGKYSLDAIAAVTPAGLLALLGMCFFTGVVDYTNTFIAQYSGAGALRRVGRALWQALYFAGLAGLLLAVLSFTGGPIFRLAGHAPHVAALEATCFQILMQGAGFALLHDALACFYSGRGLTRVIMVINVIGVGLNIPLNYVLIFGWGPLPEMGIAGSALATVTSHAVMLILFILMVFSRRNNARFGLVRAYGFDRDLFRRLLAYGSPAGLQFFVDIFAFTFFLLIVGRLGRDALAATNMALAINTLAFMPMLGFSIATSTLVGQAIGRGAPEDGVTATRSALHLTMAYMWLAALVFILFPEALCNIFRPAGEDGGQFAAIRDQGVVLLRFVALYSLLDTMNVVYAATLKGAGDTRFVGWSITILSLGILVVPTYLGVVWFHGGLYLAWSFATAYVCVVALLFRWRYRQGRWKQFRVIEVPPPLPIPEVLR